MLKPLSPEDRNRAADLFKTASKSFGVLRPLTPEDRKAAREAFHEVMNTHDEDPLAIAAVVTVRSLLLAKRKNREEAKHDRSAKEQPNGNRH